LFLDELGELPQSMQAKLLRVLQDGQFRRVGESELQRADFRLIAATNRDLRQLDRRGHLRSDLYYRVAVIQLELPPLRDRREDIEPLAHAFARRLANAGPPDFTPACRAALAAHGWPGNVRELRNAIEHALVLADGATIDVEHLPVAVQEVALAGAAAPARGSRFEQMEIESILRAMLRTGGNQTDAAALLGVTRRTLGYRIAKYGLQQRIEEQLPRRRVARVSAAGTRWDSQSA
jgi:DNA-binding NtrC family response regulator